MGENEVACENLGYMVFAVQDGVYDAVDVAEEGGLEHVFGYGIRFYMADLDVRVEGIFGWVEVHGVVMGDGFCGGEAGYEGLSASSESAEIVENDVACKDNAVGLFYSFVDFYGCSTGRGAYAD